METGVANYKSQQTRPHCHLLSMLESHSDQKKDSSNIWYSKHPIISTVLWMIGGQENEMRESSSSSGKLTWKDAHGANLAEFISDVQSSSSSSQRTVTSDGSSTFDSFPSRRKQIEDIASMAGNGEIDRNNDSVTSDVHLEHNKSPQWDQFVVITPNTQQYYAK